MSHHVFRWVTCAFMIMGAAAVAQAPPAPAAPRPAPAGSSLLSGMDRAVKPGADFYSYANGDWERQTVIPADRGSYSTWVELAEQTLVRVHSLIGEIPMSTAPPGSDEQKIADYYGSYMDEAGIEARGLAVLKSTFDRIEAINDRDSLARFLGSTLRADVDVLNYTNYYTDNAFGLWVAQDLDNPERYLPFLLQGGLGMPDRGYYLGQSPQMEEIRKHYRAYIANVLRLAGQTDAEQKAAGIFALERRIALTHATVTETEDVNKGDNHWTSAQFRRRAPGLNWREFFTAAGLGSQREFIAWQPGAINGIAALAASEPLDTWKSYLKFHAIKHAAVYLPRAFVDEDFAFYGKALEGTPQIKERWKRAVAQTNFALGQAVGRLYVQRHFPPQDKARIEDLVRHLIGAFAVRIDTLAWMSPETKAKAKAKLATMRVGVGYPDRWRDYSDLRIVAGDAYGNFARAERFDYQRNIRKLGAPVDRSEWAMTPQLVNAVNLPVMNAINFPAAILQPPFFDSKRPDSMNYGAIGATIGHEISHSFDNEGARFDSTGRMRNWWTDEDFARFKASSALLIKQFDAYRPFPDLAVNGAQTLNENIADVAGLAAAYTAYHQSLGTQTPQTVDGFTGDQQFFVSFEQTWRDKAREPLMRKWVVVDQHAPSQYRALTVRNNDAWYLAFGVEPGDALYLAPAERVQIW